MLSRRDFLRATAAAAPMLISSRAFGRSGPGANGTVNVGLIGLGGRCRDIEKTCREIPGLRVVAVCDCLKPRVDAFMKEFAGDQGWTPYLDFRDMIDKENLDGVMIETTTHARAWVACYAMAAGLDVYIEKPMCLTIAEGREMVEVARRHQRVTQVGTQQRSMPLNNWASDLVKNGELGKVTQVWAPNFLGPMIWEPKPAEPMPEGSNEGWWEVWTNQAEYRPYHPDLHLRWSQWRDYDGGGRSFGVTGWGAHSYDQIQRGLGTDETGPIEVTLEEPVRELPACPGEPREGADFETGKPYYHMTRNSVGPRAKVRMKYANGTEVFFHLDGDKGPGLGCIFVGEKGYIDVGRDKIYAEPYGLIDRADRPASLSVPETQPHIENWIECIKTRARCTADIEFGQRSSTLCYLVNIARDIGQVGRPLRWDPEMERFLNCDAGNRMLSSRRRRGYRLRHRKVHV